MEVDLYKGVMGREAFRWAKIEARQEERQRQRPGFAHSTHIQYKSMFTYTDHSTTDHSTSALPPLCIHDEESKYQHGARERTGDRGGRKGRKGERGSKKKRGGEI